jgi:hypothetical protein
MPPPQSGGGAARKKRKRAAEHATRAQEKLERLEKAAAIAKSNFARRTGKNGGSGSSSGNGRVVVGGANQPLRTNGPRRVPKKILSADLERELLPEGTLGAVDNQLVVDPTKPKPKVKKPAAEVKGPPMSKAQRKRMAKRLENKEKEARRAAMLEKLAQHAMPMKCDARCPTASLSTSVPCSLFSCGQGCL